MREGITGCGVALDLLCLLDCDFPWGIHILTYAMEDEYPLGTQSLIDIINLKPLNDLFITFLKLPCRLKVIIKNTHSSPCE